MMHPFEYASDSEAYAEYLEREIEQITEILTHMLFAYYEEKPTETYIFQIEDWLGDDWHLELDDDSQERLEKTRWGD